MKKIYTAIILILAFPICHAFAYGDENTVTGASSAKILSEDLISHGVNSVADALYGKLPGLFVMQTSSGPKFYIRGQQTLTDNGIIILVDGFERPIDNLRPEEVESVSVLRDAAAVALYGFRGVNGILSIKTKRSRTKGLKVGAGYEHYMTSAFRIPEMASAYDYANAVNMARANDGLPVYYGEAALSAFKDGSDPELYPNVDWIDASLRDFGHADRVFADFEGGGKRLNYYVMVNLHDERGLIDKNLVKSTSYPVQFVKSRANIRTNMDVQITPLTTMKLNVAGMIAATNKPHGTDASSLMKTLYTLPSAAFPIKFKDGSWGGDYYWKASNPIANITATGYDQTNVWNLMSDVEVRQNLNDWTEGLSAKVRLGYDAFAEFKEDRYTGFQYNGDMGNKAGDLKFSRYLNYQYRRTNLTASVDYDRTFGLHHCNFSLGYAFQNHSSSWQNNTFFRHNLSLVMHYDYDSRYFADVLLVGSGSNRSVINGKYAFSPTVALAWMISNEQALKGTAVNEMKLRLSAGILHNDYFPYPDMTNQNFASGAGSSYIYGNNTQVWGQREGRLPLAHPQLERASKFNIGYDIGVFNALSFSVDGYYQIRDRIIVSSDDKVSDILGVEAPFDNKGRMDSYGADISLGYKTRFDGGFFSAKAMASYAKNIVHEMNEADYLYHTARKTGHAKDQFMGWEVAGFYKDGQDILDSPLSSFGTVKPGDLKYKDQNSDNVIDDNDRIAIGYDNVVPKWYFSLDLAAEFYGVGIQALFQGAACYTAYLSVPGVYQPIVNNWNISEHYLQNVWTPENTAAKYPRLSTGSPSNNHRQNSLWLQDASFLKLRQLSVYYNFPERWMDKIKIDNLRLFLSGYNLFSIDKIKIMDPEGVNTDMPANRVFTAGLSVTF